MKVKNLFLIAIAFTISLQSCSKTDSENELEKEDTDAIDASEYSYYISGKMNGKEFIYGRKEMDTNPNYQLVHSSPLEDAVCAYGRDQGLDYKVSYSSTIYPIFDNEDSQPSMSIDFIRFYGCSESQSSSEVFNSLFSIDEYDYANDDNSSGASKHMGIIYSPIATGNKYYESYGETQSSSIFEITYSEDNNYFNLYSQSVEGKFSVKLYNVDDSSDVIEITEGKFKIPVYK